MCLAIPGQIVEMSPDLPPLALVDVAGVRGRVDLGLLNDDPPQVGDWVLIHVGFALSKISEAEAQDQMRILSVLGEDTAAMEEVQGYGLGEPDRPSQAPPSPPDRELNAEERDMGARARGAQ